MTGPSPAPLAEKADIVRGVTFSKADAVGEPRDGYSPVLRAGNIQGQLILDHGLVFVPESKISEKQRLRCGDIVMCTSSGSTEIVGKTAYSEKDWDGSFGAFCAVVRPKEGQCHPRYLFHYLQSPKFRDWTRNSSGAGIKNIRKSELDAVEISFPNIDEQRRIARILDKAEAIRRKREQALDLADEFLRASFLEIFGDPREIQNSDQVLDDIADVARGRFSPRPRNDPRYYGGDFPFIQTGEIANSDGYLFEFKQTLNEKGIGVSKCFPSGTVLVAIVGATIGATAVSSREFYCPDSVIGITSRDEEYPPEFIEYLLRFWRPVFVARAPETARANINLQTLKPVPIPQSANGEAKKFGALYKKIHSIKSRLRNSEQSLLEALSQRAFSGEL